MIKIIAQVVGSGPRGETGPQGEQGIQGEQGLKGDKGDQGLQGIQGPQGIKGDKGDTGDQGIQGIQGLQGPQGIKGDTGDDGYTPVKGIDYFTDVEKTEMLAPITDEVSTARKGKATLGEKISEIDSQLAEKATQAALNVEKARIDLLKTSAGDYYIKCLSTDSNSLLIVTSGATTGQINLASVTPRLDTYTPIAGDYVRLISNGLTAETVDIRAGENGIVYTSAGTAVRGQFNAINKSITTGKNRFNKNNIESGWYYSASSGSKIANASWGNIRLNIVAGEIFTTTGICICAFFTSGGTFISASNEGSNVAHTFTAPANTSYVMVSISLSIINTFQLETGSAATPYESFYNKFAYDYEDARKDLPTEITVDGDTKLYDVLNQYRGVKNVTVYVNKDIDIIEELGADFIQNYTTGGIEGYLIGSGIHLIFASGVRVTCNYTGSNTTFIANFSPFSIDKGYLFDGVKITNLHLIASRVRYCIHDELYNRTGMCRHVYENCIFELDNRNCGKTDVYCIGCGSGLNSAYVFDKCVFKAYADEAYLDRQYGIFWHTSVDGNGKCNLAITNNYFKDGICLASGGSGTVETTALISGNRMGKAILKKYNDGGYTNDTITVFDFNNIIAV